jgi:MATE family multidrug resistance protein
MDKIQPISYFQVFSKAWPIILANCAVPLLGLVDTATIGHFGNTQELAALAIASLLFNFIYWGFGFLRMSTTGFVSRAQLSADPKIVMRLVTQSVLFALSIAIFLLVFHTFLLHIGLNLLAPPESVKSAVEQYFTIRIWGAPATLTVFVFSGVFIGSGKTRTILLLQIVLNVSNAILDVWFAGVLKLGIVGIAWGTVMAEYMVLVLALILVGKQYPWRRFFTELKVSDLRSDILELVSQNSDIFIRTLFLLAGFGFFANISGRYGETALAANHILQQFISFSAFFLDGYAHVLEFFCGKAYGRKSIDELKDAIFKTSVFALCTGVCLAAIFYIFGDYFMRLLTNKAEVIAIAGGLLCFVAIYISCASAAYQLDGLYIGTGYSSAMRNASIASTLSFVLIWFVFFQNQGVEGNWTAFVLFVVLRSIFLLIPIRSLYRMYSPSSSG